MNAFKLNTKYETRSVCDYDAIFAYTVIKRTKCFVTLQNQCGDIKRVKVSVRDDAEFCYPEGRYSMAPVLNASRVSESEKPKTETHVKKESLPAKSKIAKDKLINKIKELSTSVLKETAGLLMSRFDDGAGVAFVFVLDELEKRLSDEDFIQFCDAL